MPGGLTEQKTKAKNEPETLVLNLAQVRQQSSAYE